MKAAALLMLALSAASLSACAYPDPDAGGNPNHFAYAGDPGSAYDRAANPPKDIGQVAYNPDAPLADTLPADAPPTQPAAETAPVLPTPPNPNLARPPGSANPMQPSVPGAPNPMPQPPLR